MDFKIDTKDTFSIISPVTDTLNAKMTVELDKKCAETRQKGSKNIIIDLTHCKTADADALDGLVNLHDISYSEDNSLVFTAVGADIINALKENELDLLLNIAPTMAEAIDIVNMEILERDLLSEE